MSKTCTATREILAMHKYMRPSGSDTELAFIKKYLDPLGFVEDDHGNLVLAVGDNPNKILFSSHVDTVHYQGGMQNLYYDGQFLKLSKADKSKGSNCLGADDTAGIWLMLELVRAGVEGLYIIHYGEESGCIGSSALAESHADDLRKMDIAIAFDRRGYDSIVTHQCGIRTCSDAFARSLSAQLGLKMEPDEGGAFTDTNEYADLIPECTNISVGYFDQHTRSERLDVPFLIQLRDALLCVDWSALKVARDPNVIERRQWSSRFYGSTKSSATYGAYDKGFPWDDLPATNQNESLSDLVVKYPDVVVSILEAYGIGASDIMDEMDAAYGGTYSSGNRISKGF